MKIERLSENQIRCTLTSADLASRKIRISELAYGTDKARELFRDMMLRARTECGFDAEDVPLMIEAIPMNSDSIVLVITKVEDPAELDTRFAHFSPDEGVDGIGDPLSLTGADDIISRFKDMMEEKKASSGAAGGTRAVELMRLFFFDRLDTAVSAAKALGGSFRGKSALYRKGKGQPYELIVRQSGHTPEEFNKVCNTLSEYASYEDCTPAREASLAEHADVILKKNAVQSLAGI